VKVLRKAIVVGGLSLAMVGAGAGAAWAGTPAPVAPRQAPGAPVRNTAPIARQAPAAPAVRVGRVVRGDARSLTVRGNDGRTQVYVLTPRTLITENGRPAAQGRLAPGDFVTVTATPNGRSLVATRVLASRR
jgi:hypothetical protein